MSRFVVEVTDRLQAEADPVVTAVPLPDGVPLDDVVSYASALPVPPSGCVRVIETTPAGVSLFLHFKQCDRGCPGENGIPLCTAERARRGR